MAMFQIDSIGLPTSNMEQKNEEDSTHTMLSATNIHADTGVDLNKTGMTTQADIQVDYMNKNDESQLAKVKVLPIPADVDQNGGTANYNDGFIVNDDLVKTPKSTKRGRPRRSIKPKEGISEGYEPLLAMDLYAETREGTVQPMETDKSEVAKEGGGIINTNVNQSEMLIDNHNDNTVFPEGNAVQQPSRSPISSEREREKEASKSGVEISTGNHDAIKVQDDSQPSALDIHEVRMIGTDHIVNPRVIDSDTTENGHDLKDNAERGSRRPSKSKRKEGTEQGDAGKTSRGPGRPPKSARNEGMSEIHDSMGKKNKGLGRPSKRLIKEGTKQHDPTETQNIESPRAMTDVEGNSVESETGIYVTSSAAKIVKRPGRPPKTTPDVSQAMNSIASGGSAEGKPAKRTQRLSKSATKGAACKETDGNSQSLTTPPGVDLDPVGKTARRPGRPPKLAIKGGSKETQDNSPSKSTVKGGCEKHDASLDVANQPTTEISESLTASVAMKDGSGPIEGKETQDNSEAFISQEDCQGIDEISGNTNKIAGRPPKQTMKPVITVLVGMETQNINSQPMMPQETNENVSLGGKVNRGSGRPPKSTVKDESRKIKAKDTLDNSEALFIQEFSGRTDEITLNSAEKTKKGPGKRRKTAMKETQEKCQIVENLECNALVVHQLRTPEESLTGAVEGSLDLKPKDAKPKRRPRKTSKSIKTVEAQLCLNADGTATEGLPVSLYEVEEEQTVCLPGQESYSANLSKVHNSHVIPDGMSSGLGRGRRRSPQSKKKSRPRKVSECGLDIYNSQLNTTTMQDSHELYSERPPNEETVVGIRNSNGEGTPSKSTTRGRPKGSVNKKDVIATTGRALELHKVLNKLVANQKSTKNKHEDGGPKIHSGDANILVINNDNNVDIDEHGSAGEEEECDDDTLEAEGPVLDDVSGPDMNEFNDSVPAEWKSGHHLDIEPAGTFKTLPSFSGESGPDLGYLPQEFCEFHLFLNLFPLDLIDHIINETNLYVEKEQRKSNIQDWLPLDRHSFIRFLGLALAMSLQFMGSEKYYWRNDVRGAVKYPDYSELMSFTNFQQIKRFLHLKDNALRPLKGCREHKLWQLLEFEKRLNHTFRKAYKLGHSVTVGERIIPSNDKYNPCRVYNPRGPHKFGTQVWDLCDSSSGYNFSFRIHDRMPCKDLAFNVVTNLVKDLPSRGHQVYFDSRFTSIKLLKHLSNEGHGGTGTYVNISKHFPLLCQGKQSRGSSKFAYCDKQGLVACSWVDRKEMYFASNCLGMRKGEVKRLTSDGQEIKIPCPEIVIKYLENKSGCDIFDNMILERGLSLQTTMSGFKWWHSVFWGLMDSVFTNCWILWKEIHHGKDISKFEFMVNLQEQLVHNSFKPYIPMIPLVQDIYHGHFLTRLNLNANRFCVVCSAARKKQISEGGDVGSSHHHPTRTIWGCGKCMKTMCADPCFKLYHEQSLGLDSPCERRLKTGNRGVPTMEPQE